MIRNLGRFVVMSAAVFVMIGCSAIVTKTAEEASPMATRDSETVGATPSVKVAPTVEETAQENEEEKSVFDAVVEDRLTTQAAADLADRLSISVDLVDVLEVRSVTWPDGSLGCAEPGELYAETEEDGLLIRLSAGGTMYFYHSGADGEPFLCERTTQIVPKVTPKSDEFVPPPDSEID